MFMEIAPNKWIPINQIRSIEKIKGSGLDGCVKIILTDSSSEIITGDNQERVLSQVRKLEVRNVKA
jgi:hypothetical protein